MPRKLLVRVSVALAFALAAVASGVSRAADFRVENRVFVDDEEEAASKSTTIFHRGVVYDFLDDPAEVIIFDSVKRRFILLDVDRKMRTDLSPTVVRQAIDRLKQLAKGTKNRKTRFLYSPVFEHSVDEETGELVFESDWISYRVLGARVGNAEMVRQYGQFSDWYARLNTFLRPGSRPPFARLVVNEALTKRDEIPSRIVLTVKRRRALGYHKEQLRGEHRVIKRLVESDLRRVAGAGEQMAAFKRVGLREYERRPEGTEEKPGK